jgi:hypothetical protein
MLKFLHFPSPYLSASQDMAQETFAYNIAEKVLMKLGSLAFQEACLVCGVESDLERLANTLSNIKAVLLDAEEKQVHNQQLTVWLGKLKEVFYDAQDVVDEFECEVLQKQVVETHWSITKKVRRFFSLSNSLVFQTKMAHKIKGIRVRLDDVAADRIKFHYLSERLENVHVVRGKEMSHSFARASDVIGRDQDKENIVQRLMHASSDSQNVSVIAVVGIGGLGKTALAKLVYNDARVVDHFELNCWVCVSESNEFALKQLLVKIISSISGENCNDLDEEQLQMRLRNNLDGRKFLLVLDDVWNEDRTKWMELRGLLMGGANGSKILVTTRSHRVASMMGGTESPYNLEGLPHKECLSLFVQWAFDEGTKRQHANLVEIGDEIVKKCKGVPLAVKSLGSLLYSKFEERDWLIVKDNEIWKLDKKEGDILSALQLSYNQMPSSLKQCFAYCSLYPKDYVYSSLELIQLWMAHGLLESPYGNQEPEDIGNQYVDELYSRSFLEDYTDVGCFRLFRIHDLAHDLALSVAQSECLIINCQTQKISKKVWHLSFFDNTWQKEDVLKCFKKSKSIRTIFCPIEGVRPSIESYLDACFSRFRYLRVLDLSEACFEVLPSSISTMKHLRWLDLRGNCRIKKLPNSICKLQNLQTLNVKGCVQLEELPKDIRLMVSLRFLEITTKQKSLPESLNSLRLLIIFNCGNIESLFGVTQGYTSLRMLSINNCGGLMSLFPSLKCLTALEVLNIKNCERLVLTEGEDNQEEFKMSLRVLRMFKLPQLVALPHWIKKSAKTLQSMAIDDCPNLAVLPEWLPNLVSLKLLVLKSCPKLASLSEGTCFFPSLRSFIVQECPELIGRCQPEIGEDWHKIAHVSEIRFDKKRIK